MFISILSEIVMNANPQDITQMENIDVKLATVLTNYHKANEVKDLRANNISRRLVKNGL